MIYDIFTFNNELDMLELRLNLLNEYVDYFVIVEANEKFSGEPKPLNYLLNKDRFKSFHHKIIHRVISDTPKSFDDLNCNQTVLKIASESSNVTREHPCWLKEFYQKELIKDALIHLQDDDVCYVSDVDEIWNYNDRFEIDQNSIYKFNIELCYIEYLNVRTNENWTYFTGPIVTRYRNIKNACLNHLRTYGKMKDVYQYRPDGGWHFNALGGVIKKVQDFNHPYYSLNHMASRRNGLALEESKLPQYIIDNKEKFKHLFITS